MFRFHKDAGDTWGGGKGDLGQRCAGPATRTRSMLESVPVPLSKCVGIPVRKEVKCLKDRFHLEFCPPCGKQGEGGPL